MARFNIGGGRGIQPLASCSPSSTPTNAAVRPAATDRATLPKAIAAEPVRARTTVSEVNVENVVNPPRNPKKRANRFVGPSRPA